MTNIAALKIRKRKMSDRVKKDRNYVRPPLHLRNFFEVKLLF